MKSNQLEDKITNNHEKRKKRNPEKVQEEFEVSQAFDNIVVATLEGYIPKDKEPELRRKLALLKKMYKEALKAKNNFRRIVLKKAGHRVQKLYLVLHGKKEVIEKKELPEGCLRVASEHSDWN